jgi:hypothetical protein
MDSNLIPNKIFDWSKSEEKTNGSVTIKNDSTDMKKVRRKDKNLNPRSAIEAVSKIHNSPSQKMEFISDCSENLCDIENLEYLINSVKII